MTLFSAQVHKGDAILELLLFHHDVTLMWDVICEIHFVYIHTQDSAIGVNLPSILFYALNLWISLN